MVTLIIIICSLAIISIVLIMILHKRKNRSLDKFLKGKVVKNTKPPKRIRNKIGLILILALSLSSCEPVSDKQRPYEVTRVEKAVIYDIHYGAIETVNHPNGCTLLVWSWAGSAGTMLHDPTCNNPKHTDHGMEKGF